MTKNEAIQDSMRANKRIAELERELAEALGKADAMEAAGKAAIAVSIAQVELTAKVGRELAEARNQYSILRDAVINWNDAVLSTLPAPNESMAARSSRRATLFFAGIDAAKDTPCQS